MTTAIATVTTSTPAAQHPAIAYLARLAPRSRRTMRGALERLAQLASGGTMTAETCPWQELTYAHTAALRSALLERYSSPATVNRHLAALRGVLRECLRLGLMSPEDHVRAIDLAPARGSRLPAGREVAPGEIHALFAACAADTSPAGARDAALLALLYGCGLRRSEAVALDVASYDAATGELRVLGKGNKARLAFLTNGTRRAVEAWLAVRGDAPGALLCPVNKAGKVTVRRMTDQAVLYRLRTRAEQAGVATFSPHDLRRSFVSHLLEAGADISSVQGLAGHASVTTTQRYDRRGDGAKRRAVELLHVPFSPTR